MDTTNKPGPTSKRKSYRGLHLVFIILRVVVFVSVLLPEVTTQSILELHCENNSDCRSDKWMFPFPQKCENNTCTCRDGSCVHYTTIHQSYYNYYCGDCGGTIGSVCTDGGVCQFPGVCYKGFCRCQSATYLLGDVCVKLEPASTSVQSIILISVLIFILILNKLIVSYSSIKKLFLRLIRCKCCRRRGGSGDSSDEETAYGYNEEGREKSAAYTISSREFISSTDDPDLEWALELSTQLARSDDDERRRRDLMRFTQRNRRQRRRSELESVSPNSSFYSSNSSSSTFSTPASSSRYTTPNGTARQSARAANRRRGFYSLFNDHENSGEEVILTKILNHKSTPPSESSEEFAETTLQSNTPTEVNIITPRSSTSPTPSSSSSSATSPASVKRRSLSEEASGHQGHVSTLTGVSETRVNSDSDNDFSSTCSSL